MMHVIRMAAELGHVHVDEVFTQTHLPDTYVDERSRKTIEDFSTRLTQARSEVGFTPDAASRTDANEDIMRTQCWVDVVKGKKKGIVYGVGQLASNYSAARGGILKHQLYTSSTTEQINMVNGEAYDAVMTRLEIHTLGRSIRPIIFPPATVIDTAHATYSNATTCPATSYSSATTCPTTTVSATKR